MNYVYEVYKERSFSKAAANLYISQPSLSTAVKKVEEKIGAPIFDRSVSPIKLTDCGRHYIKAVEEIMDIQNQFETYMTDINELKTGQVAIRRQQPVRFLYPSSDHHEVHPEVPARKGAPHRGQHAAAYRTALPRLIGSCDRQLLFPGHDLPSPSLHERDASPCRSEGISFQ